MIAVLDRWRWLPGWGRSWCSSTSQRVGLHNPSAHTGMLSGPAAFLVVTRKKKAQERRKPRFWFARMENPFPGASFFNTKTNKVPPHYVGVQDIFHPFQLFYFGLVLLLFQFSLSLWVTSSVWFASFFGVIASLWVIFCRWCALDYPLLCLVVRLHSHTVREPHQSLLASETANSHQILDYRSPWIIWGNKLVYSMQTKYLGCENALKYKWKYHWV